MQSAAIPFDWHFGLPTIRGEKVTLREVQDSDAEALLAMLTSEEVAEFVSPLPRTVEGFADSSQRRIMSGRVAIASVSVSCPTATKMRWGCFKCGSSNPDSAARSGDSPSARRSGAAACFVEGAKAVIDFSFGVVGVQRLEARSIASNGRGNAALRKVGALQEGILRRSFQRNGRYFDQILWSIVKDDWRQANPGMGRADFH